MKMVLITLAVVAATPAAAADQFDLICKGTSRYLNPNTLTDNADVVDVELRVDLKSMTYCSGECTGTQPIFRADAQNITFEQSYFGDPVYGTKQYTVSRVSGKYVYLNSPRHDPWQYKADAQCEAAPFKGFPHPLTKF